MLICRFAIEDDKLWKSQQKSRRKRAASPQKSRSTIDVDVESHVIPLNMSTKYKICLIFEKTKNIYCIFYAFIAYFLVDQHSLEFVCIHVHAHKLNGLDSVYDTNFTLV